jgi:hypothetical protein
MVRADDEWLSSQIRPPVPHRLDEPDQLLLVSDELGMRADGTTEERQWPVALVQDRTEART